MKKVLNLSKRGLFKDVLDTIWEQFQLSSEPEFSGISCIEDNNGNNIVNNCSNDSNDNIDDNHKDINDNKDNNDIGNKNNIGNNNKMQNKTKDCNENKNENKNEIPLPATTTDGTDTTTTNTAIITTTNNTDNIIATTTLPTPTPYTPSTPSSIPYDQFRLRHYLPSTKICQNIFDIKNELNTLEFLGFTSNKCYKLEIKNKSDVFDVYYNDGFTLLLEEYDVEENMFKDSRTVRMQKASTLEDLRGE